MDAIDQYMPRAEISSRHSTWIAAPPARVAAVLETADFGRPWLVRGLMGLRLLPALLLHPRATWRRWREPRTPSSPRGVLGMPFTVLAHTPDEIVLGLQGRFWTPTGGLVAIEPRTFVAGPPSGLAQAVWNFHLRAERDGTRLTTETRVRTGDPATARAFRRYWRLIGPFSGLTRRQMLALIRRTAESSAAAP